MGSGADADEEIKFDASNLSYHYERHRDEWPNEITEQGYEGRARRLLTARRARDDAGQIRGFTRRRGGPDVSRGDLVRYDPGTNEYATMTRDRVFKTLFRPLNGEDYYLDDVDEYGGGHDAVFTAADDGSPSAE